MAPGHELPFAASFSQMAGIEALTGPQDDVENGRQFRLRRDAIVAGL